MLAGSGFSLRTRLHYKTSSDGDMFPITWARRFIDHPTAQIRDATPRHQPVTAEHLLQDMTAQIDFLTKFLESANGLLSPYKRRNGERSRGERVCRGNHLRGVWPKPSFLRYLGLSDNHNVERDLKQGRKVRRLEAVFGPGIALLIVPVMSIFRRMSRRGS
ncbi:hypothetical protein N7470_007810 [Penicillium chermesinum]|nr:hypothetical protein N7470_007810 [Penicillium chermesinum]